MTKRTSDWLACIVATLVPVGAAAASLIIGSRTPPLPPAPAHAAGYTNDSPMWPKPTTAPIQHPSGLVIDMDKAVRILIPDGYAITNVPLAKLSLEDLSEFKKTNQWAMVYFFVARTNQ